MEQPTNETLNEFTRRTCNGRILRYRLEVVQQPEKARACGAGPRSSADRRPVDPPPVVELKVYENDVDITMQYDAGFMLYASLEVARPIAHGRIHSAPTIPVLTGVAVAGAAYLDRPRPAAYFIFPDLSVRHEGWYRLRFCLFESTKHASDADADRPFVTREATELTREPVAHEALANRMEVRSVPFQVFSAKKFPGLNTSTQLSKVVADQGCRVRIRRDIRQRKRAAEKPDREIPDEDRSSYRGTPEAVVRPLDHSRSASRNSLDSQYGVDRYAPRLSDTPYMWQNPSSRQPSIPSMTAPSPLTKQTAQAVHQLPPPPSAAAVSSMQAYSSPAAPRPADNKISAYVSLPRLPEMPVQTPSDPSHHRYTSFTNPPPAPERKSSNITLPPIGSIGGPTYESHGRRQYTLPEPATLKRSYSPHTYGHNSSIKSGARPDSIFPPKPSGLSIAGLIEPDTGRDDDDDFDDEEAAALSKGISYKRADGSTEYKLSFIMNSPHRR